MRRQLVPTALAIGVGVIVLAQLLIRNAYLEAIGGYLVAWGALIAAFAVLLGLFNVLAVHLGRVAERGPHTWSSAVVLISAALMLLVVLPSGGASRASGWALRYWYQPLEASFLALVVLFIASAAYRSLRMRSWQNALLVAGAVIVLAGAVPVANLITPWLPAAREWVLEVPTLAAVRGILLGVALGVVATGLRLLTGIDRPYAD